MSWKRARFKGQDVWVQVTADGELVREAGRVPIRYQAKVGAKVYRAAEGRVELVADAEPEALDEGVPAEDARLGSSQQVGTPGGYGKAGSRTESQAAMAVEAAQELVSRTEGKGIICFTDGACKGNPGVAGAGAVVMLPNGERGEASRSLGRATNNIAELTGIALAMQLLDQHDVNRDAPGIVLTDSAYVHGVLARGWKAKANQALVADLKTSLSERPRLTLHWIAGHVGIEGNERADALANQGVTGLSTTSWS